MYLTNRKRANRQQGMSLVEAMISLLVISIGLLGIASLQITAMKQNATALNHSQAVWVGYNMADRIRANITQFVIYAGVDTSSTYSRDCMSGPCTNVQMVESDAEEWSTQVQNLSSGRGLVTGDATQLVIAVMWDDDGTGATGTGCGSNPEVDLTCYTVTLVQ